MDSTVYTSAVESVPPSSDRLGYISLMEARAIIRRQQVSDRRMAVQISSTTFVLCDPEEEITMKRRLLG